MDLLLLLHLLWLSCQLNSHLPSGGSKAQIRPLSAGWLARVVSEAKHLLVNYATEGRLSWVVEFMPICHAAVDAHRSIDMQISLQAKVRQAGRGKRTKRLSRFILIVPLNQSIQMHPPPPAHNANRRRRAHQLYAPLDARMGSVWPEYQYNN